MARTHGCRRAAQLLSEEHERALRMTERMGLRIHLWMCTGCMTYAKQLTLLERAALQWRADDATKTGS